VRDVLAIDIFRALNGRTFPIEDVRAYDARTGSDRHGGEKLVVLIEKDIRLTTPPSGRLTSRTSPVFASFVPPCASCSDINQSGGGTQKQCRSRNGLRFERIQYYAVYRHQKQRGCAAGYKGQNQKRKMGSKRLSVEAVTAPREYL